MDELLKSANLAENITPSITIWSVIFSLLLAASLSVLIGMVYRKIHSEGFYSQTLVHTLVLLSMITALIMGVIGSNIARAFSLVGALSIIRFRTAIKSPYDVAFIFLSIAIGMTCGTNFYAIAVVGTLIIAGILLILVRLNFGSAPGRTEHLLSIVFHMNTDYESALEPLLGKFFDAYSLAYVETVRQGTQREVVYSVCPKAGIRDTDIIDAVTKINDNLKVQYRVVRRAIDVP